MADGEAGPKFTQAVKNYQKTGNGSIDGEITAKQKTWKRLLNYTAPAPQPEPEPIPQPQPVPKEEPKDWKIGDAAKIIADSSLIGGKKILPWVFKNKVYVRDFRENESVIISTQKAGPILGAIYLKDLLHYSNEYYDVSVVSNLLNVREAPEANSKIVKQIKKNTQYTIIEEKSGWGHIANSGWVMLQYVRKV